jgi:hypothetical protein
MKRGLWKLDTHLREKELVDWLWLVDRQARCCLGGGNNGMGDLHCLIRIGGRFLSHNLVNNCSTESSVKLVEKHVLNDYPQWLKFVRNDSISTSGCSASFCNWKHLCRLLHNNTQVCLGSALWPPSSSTQSTLTAQYPGRYHLGIAIILHRYEPSTWHVVWGRSCWDSAIGGQKKLRQVHFTRATSLRYHLDIMLVL